MASYLGILRHRARSVTGCRQSHNAVGSSEAIEQARRVRWAQYLPLAGRTRAAQIALGVVCVFVVVMAISTYAEIQILERIDAATFVTDEEIESNDIRQGLIALAFVLVFIGTVVLWCVWIHRASKNLWPLAINDQRFSPRWAVGWWFVPIMWYFRPYQVVKEIWLGSDPNGVKPAPWGVDVSAEWRSFVVWPGLGWWWGFWVLALSSSSGSGDVLGDDIGRMIFVDYVAIATHVILIVAAVLAIRLIGIIDVRQDQKHRRIIESDKTAASASPGPQPASS